jgi:hypothetical protein
VGAFALLRPPLVNPPSTERGGQAFRFFAVTNVHSLCVLGTASTTHNIGKGCGTAFVSGLSIVSAKRRISNVERSFCLVLLVVDEESRLLSDLMVAKLVFL